MVSPDGDAREAGVEAPRSQRQLALGTILVQPRQRVEILSAQARRILHADQRVGVAGIAHHQHFAVSARHLVQRATLPTSSLLSCQCFNTQT